MHTATTSRLVTLAIGVSLAALAAPAGAYNFDPDYFEYDGGTELLGDDSGLTPSFAKPAAAPAKSASVGMSFDGISQLTVRSLHSNFSEIPPDTMGAVGKTQFMEVSNGAYAVYDKATGAQTKLWADGNFWEAAGQPASNGAYNFSNGDSRVLYDKPSGRWIVESFGADLSTIQIAVSNTSDATAGFRSTTFTGFAGGIADYPTLGIDNKAIYIGTNDFGGPDNSFQGTTLNVLSRSALLNAAGPEAKLVQFFTPYTASSEDRGYAIQGVNQVGGSDSGRVIAVAAKDYGEIAYTVNNAGHMGATQSLATIVDDTPYMPNQGAAQPDGTRNIDASDDRFSSTASEYKGKIYAIHTITAPGSEHTEVEYLVTDAATGALIQKGVIGDATHDYFEGSIAVNMSGQVVIGYNRSGFDADGNVSFLAQAFNPVPGGSGAIVAIGTAQLLKVSPIDNYHNGSVATDPSVGRQRWGDYAQVTVDPTNQHSFWAIGEYALGYLPSPTASFSRWGTWISEVTVGSVPEPGTWSLMIAGVGLTGTMMRRRRALATA